MSRNLYIVPHDLTEVGNTALDYALFLGTHVRTDIMLLHLIDNKAKIAATEAKLWDIVKSNFELPGQSSTYHLFSFQQA